ncbi:hypothetical protein Enr13x_38400 [Stieleria neptunia]|uniref:Uncharacterized protein n=1 Tax=Stieleria neptunia TaxID=2527979 RepID=A0A518HT00_9BACT|nr:hypothetical protein Enr13x_38400 [Stieleria neptunia]
MDFNDYGIGFYIQNSAVAGAGLVILVHALIATLIIAVEDRRSAKPPAWGDTASEIM